LLDEADKLTDSKNQATALSLLIWLACANEDYDRAIELYTRLVDSKANKELKYQTTLRLMIFNKDQDQNEEAYNYLMRIEDKYSGFLKDQRERPIRNLDEYAKIDLVLDKAYFLYHRNDPQTATALVGSVDESDLPADKIRKYKDLQLLASAQETPAEYKDREFRKYIEIISALSRFRQYELTALWGMWLMENKQDLKIRSQLAGTVIGAFGRRETWDDLQEKIARSLLESTRAGMPIRGGDPTGHFLGMVIEHGTTEEVLSFWREEIQPHPLKASQLEAIDRLAEYLTGKGERDETRQVLEKTLKELPRDAIDTSVTELILIKYTFDLAELYAGNPDWESKGTVLVDSLKAGLSGLSREVYPYAFIAVADWKARHTGWDSMVEFVSPLGDSIIKAEKGLSVNIYDRPLIPGTPISSPLLALRCIQPERLAFQFDSDFFEVLGIKSEEADPVLKILKRSPRRLDLDCSQAQLLNWKTDSFDALLEKYSKKRR
jgi:tetratricopeptide (TPR) repeat protein